MYRIDIKSILLRLLFVILVVTLIILASIKINNTFTTRSQDTPGYTRPTWPEISETTKISESEESLIEDLEEIDIDGDDEYASEE